MEYKQVFEDIKKKLTKERSLEILFEKLDLIEDLIAESTEEISKSKYLIKQFN